MNHRVNIFKGYTCNNKIIFSQFSSSEEIFGYLLISFCQEKIQINIESQINRPKDKK